MPTITLNGCAPIPLAHYLKALGVLRIVSEQADPTAACFWREDQFSLTSCLDCNSLTEFLLHEYRPTPVLNPWNGDGGFFEDSRAGAVEVLKAISTSKSDRLAVYRATISTIHAVFRRYGILEKPTSDNEQKGRVLMALRNALPSEAIGWIDAVAVLTISGPKYPPLLGGGGNDGSMDFSKNFMQRLGMIFDLATDTMTSQAQNWLRASLFCAVMPASTTSDKIGQFFPGAAGGANSTTGFDAKPTVNPWDFVLMIEGTLLFAAASVKRLEHAANGSLAYPFCVNQVGNGYASAARADEEKAACEIWLPLWKQPVTFAELQAVFNEGRGQVRGRPARDGIDFAQAAVTHGVDRGISAFHRYAILERNGQSNFATPLGRFIVRRNARADLLADVQRWIERLRIKTDPEAKPKAPNSVRSAFALLEGRIFELCEEDSPDSLLAVLAELGAAERAIARSFKWATAKDKSHRENAGPLRALRPEWLTQIADCSETRLAMSLAGLRASFGKGMEKLWFRQHLEPLRRMERGQYFRPAWSEMSSDNDVAWHDGDLIDALNAILARRLVRVQQSSAKGWPDWSPRPAQLDDITGFIEGRVNETLLSDLIWGLSLVDWESVILDEQREAKTSSTEIVSSEEEVNATDDNESGETERASEFGQGIVPSSFYALLRLCFRRARKGEEQQAIPLVPAILHRAMNGDGKTASELAARRLRGSGKAPLVKVLPVSGDIARRTAAAILFPIRTQDVFLLERSILRPSEKEAK
jgi:CRISPR-associated protein Csx17